MHPTRAIVKDASRIPPVVARIQNDDAWASVKGLCSRRSGKIGAVVLARDWQVPRRQGPGVFEAA